MAKDFSDGVSWQMPGDVLPAEVQPEDDLHGGRGRTDAYQRWFGL